MNIFASIVLLSLTSLITFGPFLGDLSNDFDFTKITRGSSLSSNDTSPYWLSPSGNIAFGFYNQCTVGIWFPKSPHKTLVWTANHKDFIPAHKPSSILFTKEGKLILRILPDNKDKPLLPDATEPVSYAKLHDNGNFVLYGSESQIVWESFDHPTHTLLGGQKLKLGVDQLISYSGEYKLSIIMNDLAIVSNVDVNSKTVISTERWFWMPTATAPATLNLDNTGMLYLVNCNGAIREIIYEDKNQQRKLKEVDDGTGNDVKEDYIYRATLYSRGEFVLYKERIDGNGGDSLALLWASYQWSKLKIFFVGIPIFFIVLLFLLIVACVVYDIMKKLRIVATKEETRK